MITKHRIQPKREHKKFVRQNMVEKLLKVNKQKNVEPIIKNVISVKNKPVLKKEVIEDIVSGNTNVEASQEKESQEVVVNEETVVQEKKPLKKHGRKKKESETENNE